jgi:hypothetical protein
VSPPTRAGPAFAFDPVRKVTVIFGGSRSEPGKSPVFLNDMWLWDGAAWTNVQPNPLPAVITSVAAYDVARSQLVLFGYNPIERQAETWLWDGSHWSHVHPASSPGARASASMAYDSASRRVVLFGGFNNGTGTSADTWTWDGATWALARASTRYPAAPGALCGGSPLVLVAPPGPVLKTWLWESGDWKEIIAVHEPAARLEISCTFTGTDVVLFGGWAGGQFSTETWLFRDQDWTVS